MQVAVGGREIMIQGIDDRIPRVAYTIAEAAQALTISPRTIRRVIRRGELRVLYIGRAVRIPLVELEAYTRAWASQKAS
jgi:excisionase family DNA binding protein